MIKKITNLKYIFLSIISIFKLNNELKKSNKTVIFFYFPTRSFNKNIFEIIKNLNKKNKFLFYFGYYRKNYFEFQKRKNSYLINNRLLFLIKGVDIFFTSYVTDSVPTKSKSIYMHHDIFDTALVKKEDETKTLNKLNNFNYIFTSSKLQNSFFLKLYKKNSIMQKNKCLDVGYSKLQFNLLEYKKLKQTKKRGIIIYIALGPFQQNKTQSFYNKIEEFCSYFSKRIEIEKIIIRPHPLDIFSNYLNYKFKVIKNKKILIDKNKNYIHNFKNSDFLVTDISGIAYTYSFTTLKPVFFYNDFNNFNDIDYFKNSKYYYYQNKIGFRFKNLFSFKKKFFVFLKDRKLAKSKQILNLRNKIFTNKNPIKKISEIIQELD